MGTKQELTAANLSVELVTGARPDVTLAVTRGARRALAVMGQSSLVEVTLRSGRRADILAFDKAGKITIVEVKSSEADYRTDSKWQEYGEFCDLFYFAVPQEFPQDLIPQECGLMIADSYDAAILREPVETVLPSARRRSLLLKAAKLGADRLHLLQDPGLAI